MQSLCLDPVHFGTQAFDDAALGGAIEHEINRPDLVRGRRAKQRLPFGRRDFLSFAPPHLEAGLLIQALDPLVIHRVSGLAKLQIDHPDAIAFMARRSLSFRPTR